MNQKLTLSRITKDDMDESIDVFINTFSKEPWNDTFESKDQVKTFFENHINSNYFLGYTLKLDNKIIGICLGFKKPWIKGMEYYIDELCIDYDYQGKGYGKTFMSLIEKDLKKNDLVAIFLNTGNGCSAEEFYKKNGFIELNNLVILDKLLKN